MSERPKQGYQQGPPGLRIGMSVGLSIQLHGVDWVKPTVYAEVDFPEVPESQEEIEQRWRWLKEHQVYPQLDELFDMMSKEVRNRAREQSRDA